MAKDKDIREDFPIQCCGRDADGKEVLDEPLLVNLKVYQKAGSENGISISVEDCPHNTGGSSQRCKASYPLNQDKSDGGAFCPFSLDLPHASDVFIKMARKRS